MNCGPKVTAFIPSYNHGRFLRQRVESVLQETYNNIELIVIDDCSDDDSNEIINSLLRLYSFQYVRNTRNSGTPFAAWEKAASLATGEFLWICESDDFADPCFLEIAVTRLVENQEAVLFYCNSQVVDTDGTAIDHTETYFHDIWRESRWDQDFVRDGTGELTHFQLRGQTVPNMSSTLISTEAFRRAYKPFLKKLKLTGDWLFIGWVLRYGSVVFCNKTLNHYRKHEVTARVRVQSARSQAEFILTKYMLFRETGRPIRDFAHIMRTDAVRFLCEPAGWVDVIKVLLQISIPATLSCGMLLAVSIGMDLGQLKKFHQRYKLVRSGK